MSTKKTKRRTGRPKSENTVAVVVRMSPGLHGELKRRSGGNMAERIREALREWLGWDGDKP